MQMATGYWPASVLNAAVELGVFQALDGPRLAGELAVELDVDAVYLERLLCALAGLEVLTATEDGYAIPSGLAPFLGPQAEANLEGAIRYNADLYDLWGKLGSCIQSGEPVQPQDLHLGSDPESTRRFVEGMESRGKMLAPSIVNALPSPSGPRVLDLACGSGIVSRILLGKHPDVSVTLFDLPGVLGVSQRLWADANCEAQFHPGNYREDDLPPGEFDFILYCGALHQESEESASGLFHKVRRQLAPGGAFCVVDFLLEDQRTRPVFSALFSLNMMLIQPHGHVFSAGKVKDLLTDAGFCDVQYNTSAAGPYGLVVARG